MTSLTVFIRPGTDGMDIFIRIRERSIFSIRNMKRICARSKKAASARPAARYSRAYIRHLLKAKEMLRNASLRSAQSVFLQYHDGRDPGCDRKRGISSRTKKKNYMVWDSLRPASAREICKKFENNGKKYLMKKDFLVYNR